jgi:biopolymer transport protein TolQ
MIIQIPFATQLPVGVSMESAFSHDIVQMVIHAGPMVKFVLLVLLMFSVISWAIIFMKWRQFRKAKDETRYFLEVFWESRDLKKIYLASKDLRYSPVGKLFKSGYAEFGRLRKIQVSSGSEEREEPYANSFRSGDVGSEEIIRSRQAVMDNLERSLRKSSIDQNGKLERALSFLATTGNTAPFIGLFGTVWGIMESFRGIGLTGSANLAVVAPGISEALIATAAGLAAAIPAVVAFNYFSNRISGLRGEMDIFTSEFLSIIERQFLKGR